jgi:hypothetical protein
VYRNTNDKYRISWNRYGTYAVLSPHHAGHALSRASWFGQRKRHALGIEGFHCLLDCAVKRIGVTEGLMREMVRFEVAPDAFDGVQFRRILWQPFDGEPVCAGGESCQGKLTGVDRTIIQDQHHRLGRLSRRGTMEPVQLLEMSDEVAATLGPAGVDDELAADVIERPQ